MKSERPIRPSRVAPETDASSSADALRGITPGRFAALLALLILACFPQVVLGLETFYYVDYGQFGLPLAVHHRESFWRGEVPLWNPLNNCGVPFLAQWNTMTLYPLSLIYLLFPLPWSLALFCLGHLHLAVLLDQAVLVRRVDQPVAGLHQGDFLVPAGEETVARRGEDGALPGLEGELGARVGVEAIEERIEAGHGHRERRATHETWRLLT